MSAWKERMPQLGESMMVWLVVVDETVIRMTAAQIRS